MAFILAFIGAAVGLLIGIVIFGEVSDAVQCPSGGSPTVSIFNVTSYDNLGTLGSAEDAVYAESEVIVDFLPPVAGRIGDAVIQEGTSSLDLNGEIYLGSTPSDWWFLSAPNCQFCGMTASNLTSISFWINGDVVGSAEYPILSNFAPNTETDGIFIITESNLLRPQIENDGYKNIQAAFGPSSSEPPDDGQWHLITITYDKGVPEGNANMIYCLDGTTNNVGTPGTSEGCHSGATVQGGATNVRWHQDDDPPNDKLTIGSDNAHFYTSPGNTVENTFSIDDLAIWSGYILTPTDIDNLWNSGSGSPAGSISPAELRGYWSFDNSTANGVITGGGGGGGSGTGSVECESAKETAWTVIGIIPVALFFALFAIFGAIGKPQ